MLKSFLPAILWSSIILALSLGPGIQVPGTLWKELGWDKVGHLGAYLIETFLLLWGFYRIGWHHPLPAIVLAILYGVVLEVMQYAFFPHRFFEWLDLLANLLGTIAGWGVFRKLIYYLKF